MQLNVVLVPGRSLRATDEAPVERPSLELSVVMPCLNEADTVAQCVEVARATMHRYGISGEVIVADNGSVDGSIELAEKAGARVVHAAQRGYGNALLAGIAAARGRYILMGDADSSYDFEDIPKFVHELRAGASLVQGCRLPVGGGTVRPGAMPFLHRWFGNPFFSVIARWFFKAPIHDVNCGMRAFTADHVRSLDQRCTGMEFAVEMVLKSALMGAPIAEVPVTLRPDGRVNGRPHLRTFRDGWRTLRFFLICSPIWLFLLPGLVLAGLGFCGYALALPGIRLLGVGFDVNTLVVSTLAILVGLQISLFGVSAKLFGHNEGLLPEDPRFRRLMRLFTLERGLLLGLLPATMGLVGIIRTLMLWHDSAWGTLDSSHTLRVLLPSTLLIGLGVQLIFSSFFMGLLDMQRRSAPSELEQTSMPSHANEG